MEKFQSEKEQQLQKVEKHYNTERLRPYYKSFQMQPLFIMASESS